MSTSTIKQKNMMELADYQRLLWERPELRYLFFELKDCCNLHCVHCGSSCKADNSHTLPFEAVKTVLRSAQTHYDTKNIEEGKQERRLFRRKCRGKEREEAERGRDCRRETTEVADRKGGSAFTTGRECERENNCLVSGIICKRTVLFLVFGCFYFFFLRSAEEEVL